MNSEWLEQNKRALIGIVIFALLLTMNFVVRARRAKPAATAVTSPVPVTPAVTGQAPAAGGTTAFSGIPNPEQPISSLLSGITNKFTEMETRLATVPMPIFRVVLHESLSSPSRDIFHWPGSEIVVPPLLPATTTPVLAPPPATIVYLGSILRGNRKFALVRVDSKAFMIEDGAQLPATDYLLKEIASSSIDLETAEGKNRNIELNASQTDNIEKIVQMLKHKPDRSRMEIRWFPTGRTASETASQTAVTPGLTSTGGPR